MELTVKQSFPFWNGNVLVAVWQVQLVMSQHNICETLPFWLCKCKHSKFTINKLRPNTFQADSHCRLKGPELNHIQWYDIQVQDNSQYMDKLTQVDNFLVSPLSWKAIRRKEVGKF